VAGRGSDSGGTSLGLYTLHMEMEPIPYHLPQQKRSRESLERLLDAAEEQMSAVGIESFTVADVARRADLSVGAFYARFPDKKALLHAVQDRFHSRLEPLIHAEMREGCAGARSLAETVDCLIDTLVRHVTGKRELSRAFMMSSVFDPVMRDRGERVNTERREVFISMLLAHRSEIGHPDPELAINVAYGIYAAVVRGTLVFGQQHELYYDVTDQTVVQELKRALTLYLRGEGSAQGSA
jgi:AcrR family transcriptional regulator